MSVTAAAATTLASGFSEFLRFISRGNVLDLAVGLVVGQAFTRVVTSFAKDVIGPCIELVSTDRFEDGFLVLRRGPNAPYKTIEEAQKDEATILRRGAFVQTLLDFLLLAVIMFIALRSLNVLSQMPGKVGEAIPQEFTQSLRHTLHMDGGS